MTLPVTTLTVTKHHGLGNDFLVLLDFDGQSPISAELARAVCDRHRGVGADGLIRATPVTPGDRASPSDSHLDARSRLGEARLTFELRNADGGAAEMSGNGMRCLAQAALDAGWVAVMEPFAVLTPAGPRTVTVRPTEAPTIVWARVEMGRPTIGGSGIGGSGERCRADQGQLAVDVGNPHLVVLGPDPATVAVEDLGPRLERSVPGGRNVEFVALGPRPDEVNMRVWERGVGETLACGTGACAAAVALNHWGRVGTSVTVHQQGGDAVVELCPDGTIVLAGPSERVARCDVEVGGRR